MFLMIHKSQLAEFFSLETFKILNLVIISHKEINQCPLNYINVIDLFESFESIFI